MTAGTPSSSTLAVMHISAMLPGDVAGVPAAMRVAEERLERLNVDVDDLRGDLRDALDTKRR